MDLILGGENTRLASLLLLTVERRGEWVMRRKKNLKLKFESLLLTLKSHEVCLIQLQCVIIRIILNSGHIYEMFYLYLSLWYGIEFQAAFLVLRYLYLHIMTHYDFFFF